MQLLLILLFLTVFGLNTLGATAACRADTGVAVTLIPTTDSTAADAAFELACAGYKECGDSLNPYGPVADWNVGAVTSFQNFASKCTGSSLSPLSTFNPDLSKWETTSVTDTSSMFKNAAALLPSQA